MITHGIKRRSSASRPNAVEESNVLLRFEEARHPFVLCAMLPGNKRRGVDIARIAYLGRIPVALKQERLRPDTGGAQRPEEQRQKEQPSGGAVEHPQSEAASIND